MMRAALILVGVCILIAMELQTPSRVAKAVDQPLPQSTVGAGYSRDTLVKADRLEIPYFQNELTTRPISFVEPIPQADSTSVISKAPVLSKEASKSVGGDRHDVKTRKVAFVGPKPRPKITDSKPRPKTTDSKTIANTDRLKVPVEVRPCRPSAFGSFLKALNLSSGCEA